MAVANKQIEEVYDTIFAYIHDNVEMSDMLSGLIEVEAYKKNKSFKDTIDRMILLHEENIKKEFKGIYCREDNE